MPKYAHQRVYVAVRTVSNALSTFSVSASQLECVVHYTYILKIRTYLPRRSEGLYVVLVEIGGRKSYLKVDRLGRENSVSYWRLAQVQVSTWLSCEH